jgi:hypothetical protein
MVPAGLALNEQEITKIGVALRHSVIPNVVEESLYLTLVVRDVSTTLGLTTTAVEPGREAELALETTKGEGRLNSALHNHPLIPSPAAAGSRNSAMLGLGFATDPFGPSRTGGIARE